MVGATGLEPLTSTMSPRHSKQIPLQKTTRFQLVIYLKTIGKVDLLNDENFVSQY